MSSDLVKKADVTRQSGRTFGLESNEDGKPNTNDTTICHSCHRKVSCKSSLQLSGGRHENKFSTAVGTRYEDIAICAASERLFSTTQGTM